MSKLMDLTREIEEELESKSKFIKLEDKEEKVLQFDKDQIKKVKKVFREGEEPQTKLEYTVIDPEGKEKILTASMTNALVINDLLNKGKNVLAVKRFGTGPKTKYTFIPA